MVVLATAGCGSSSGAGPSADVSTPAPSTLSQGTQDPASHTHAGPPDRIERLTAPPVMANPGPARPMQTRKDFVDPPLPSELQDDGGLIPLPSANGRQEQR